MANVTITQLNQPVSVEQNSQSVTVSGGDSFPITIEYNATVTSKIADNGVPVAGAAGQILTKTSDADYDTAWQDAPQGFSGDYNDLANKPDLSNYITSTLDEPLDANGFAVNNLATITTGAIANTNNKLSVKGPMAGIGSPNGVTLELINNASPGVRQNTITSRSTGATVGSAIGLETGYNASISLNTTGSGRVSISNQRFPASKGRKGQVLKVGTGNDLEWADESNAATISENEPSAPVIGEQWFNPTTEILKIYTAAGWVQTTADDLQF